MLSSVPWSAPEYDGRKDPAVARFHRVVLEDAVNHRLQCGHEGMSQAGGWAPVHGAIHLSRLWLSARLWLGVNLHDHPAVPLLLACAE